MWNLRTLPALVLGSLVMHAADITRPSGNPAAAFQDSDYVHVGPDGKLHCKGQRVRYWGYIGFPEPPAIDVPGTHPDFQTKLAKARANIDLMVNRIHDLGFTLVRNWYGHVGTESYAVGDGSYYDLLAYYFFKLDQHGIRIWESALNDVGGIGADAVTAINEPASAAAWTAAQQELMKSNNGQPIGLRCTFGAVPQIVKAWDPRWEETAIQRMQQAATWPNHYKGGLRLCDDPQVVVWELSNEEIWYTGIFNGGWQHLPSFFRNQLLTRWQPFLADKYHTDAELTKAWQGLLPGESLTGGSVLLAPLAGGTPATTAINDTNPQAQAMLHGLKAQYTRDDFARARGADVLEFMCSLWISHKQREMARLKTWGRSTKLSPTLWDCGNCYQVQAAWMFQHSDAVGACAYVKGMGYDATTKRYPFWSGLESPPRMCWDIPWLEGSSMPGKPTFVYETQIDNRTKYRAEFPARIAALGAIQDWDIVNWHAFGLQYDAAKPEPFAQPLQIGHDYLGYGNDEVQLAAMKTAATVFTHGLLAPPAKPTVFTVGKRTLYDPASMDYGRSYGDLGKRVIPTTYRYGLRVQVDPTMDDDRIDGPSVNSGVFEPNPVRPTPQIEYDWQAGHLRFDAPAVKSYVGFFGARTTPVEFADGTRFSDVSVMNPVGIAYPVTPDERYVAITLVAQDGLPLTTSKRLLLSAVSTSFNTGYGLDLAHGAGGMFDQGPAATPPQEFFGAYPTPGTTPVLVARVSATITCAALKGLRYTYRDWHMRDIGHGVLATGAFTLPANQPIFTTELTRE